MDELPGFDDPSIKDEPTEESTNKSKKGAKKGGGFQSMGLNFNVLKGITKRGYKVPTPIQRKVSLTKIRFFGFLLYFICYRYL